MKSTITDNDIIIDGLADEVYPYLDELFNSYGWSLLCVAKLLIQEDYQLPNNITDTLIVSWKEKKENECNILV